MRYVVTRLVITLAVSGARLSASEGVPAPLPVTVQIHDYSGVPGDSLSRASAIVTQVYAQIGVRTDWLHVVRRAGRRDKSKGSEGGRSSEIAQLTIIILTPQMAARGHISDGVLGYAAVATEGMGRIAYAIYDRVRHTAADVPMNDGDLLGFVMAHEIGHLLLPRGSHLETGLMRGHWDVHDFRQVDVVKLEFSAQQAMQIRHTLQYDSPPMAARTNARSSAGADAPADAR